MSYDLLQHDDNRRAVSADIARAVDLGDAAAALEILKKYGLGIREILDEYQSVDECENISDLEEIISEANASLSDAEVTLKEVLEDIKRVRANLE